MPVRLPQQFQRTLSGSFTTALKQAIGQRFSEPVQMGRELLGGDSEQILSEVREEREETARTMQGRSRLERNLIGGLSSAATLPISLGARAIGRIPGAAGAAMTLAGAPAYFDQRLKQAPRAKALSNALAQGGIEAAGDLLQFSPFFKNRALAQRGVQLLTRFGAAEIGEEQAQNLADKLHAVAWNHPEWRRSLAQKLSEWSAEAPELARDTVVQSLVAGGTLLSTAGSGPSVRMATPQLQQTARQLAARRAPDVAAWTEENGGATWDIKRNKPIKKGFAVGAHPDRTQVVTGRASKGDIQDYIERNYDLLKQPSTYLGTWFDQQSGNTYLDVTKVLPRKQAVELARKNGELAIFDLGRMEEIRIEPEPTAPPAAAAETGAKPSADVTDLISKLNALRSQESRPYQNAPDSLMGFPKEGPTKSFDEQKYRHTQWVEVQFGDGRRIVDAVKGLNPSHALERARRNWEGATIRPVSAPGGQSAAEILGETSVSDAMFIDPQGRGVGSMGIYGRPFHQEMLTRLAGKQVGRAGEIETGSREFAEISAKHGLVRVRRDVAEFFAPPTPQQARAVSERFAGMQQALVAYSPPDGDKAKVRRISDTSPGNILRVVNELRREAQTATVNFNQPGTSGPRR